MDGSIMREPLERLLNQLMRQARDKRVLGQRASAKYKGEGDLEFHSVPTEPVEDLTGQLFLVGNRYLGIPRESRLRHPCCVLLHGSRRVWVSKGTDARHLGALYRDLYVIVHPDGKNGLEKPTAFEPILRELPIKAIFGEDHMGRLSEADLCRLKEAVGSHGR